MDVYYGLDDIGYYENVVVALGNFDGVHLGHRQLIRKTIEKSQQLNGTTAVLTFDPHPLKILVPEACPLMLLSKEEKIQKLSELGVELLIFIPFSKEFARLTPEEFVKEILAEKLRARGVVIGYNYTFGFKGQGNPETLSALGADCGMETIVVPPVMYRGVEVSSTLIRTLILNGEVHEAGKYLGYNPFMVSEVVAGDQRGRTIGFPTANLEPEENVLIPANGVYAVRVYIEGETFKGVANIGLRPTFKLDRPRNIEINIFDFCEDIYGRTIKVEFVQRIRFEQKFESIQELISQIADDALKARQVLEA
ncbi:MAG TPA: bifunctional riboflavin kinase/FAD synthetase [Desulfobacteria bacterium]|nr:bifunctional riboflavin kinase/FAD synthetase [Desulfobacteria bacterium]